MSISLFILSSCEKELYDDAIKNDARIKSVKNTTLKELLKNPNFSDVFSKVKSKTQQLKNTSARTALEDQYDFTILPEDVKVIETTDGRTSYTFQIERNTPTLEFFENLVIQLHESGDLDALIMKYTPTSLDIHSAEYIKEYTSLIQSGRVLMLSNGCIMVTYTTCCYLVPGNAMFSSPHLVTEQCTKPEYYQSNSYVSCPTFEIEGGGPAPTNNGDNDGFGGTSGSVITNPNTMSEAERKIKKFKMQLSSGQNQCFNNLPPQVKAELENYVATTLIDLEDGTTPTTNDEDPIHNEAEEMMEQMCDNQGVFNSITPFLIEKKIDDTQLNPCPKNILSKIKNLNQNDFAKIIARLGGTDSKYSLKVKSENPTYPLDYATTNWETNDGFINPYNYIIKIRPSYENTSTTLGLASTILHEFVHAYFLSLIDDCYQSNNCSLLQTFPELWNFYVAHQNGGILTDPISQHEQIALSYVDIIASALQEFDNSNGVTITDHQVYTDLAWGGLLETQAFLNSPSLTQGDKDRIIARNYAEKENSNQTNPSGVVICTPVGTPCN